MGTVVESTNEVQKVAKVRVYPGANGAFDLYRDDGTYAYEQGKFEVSHLVWDDATKKFTHSGAEVGFAGNGEAVEVVGN
jgi:alpha-D-xyloside xylohydrolase